MARLALVILAGGMGSRFGGPKQLTPVGPTGEAILDYSASAAVEAGFERVVIVTRAELDPALTRHIGAFWPSAVDVQVVHQDRHPLAVIAARRGRTKPLGTAHAALVGMGAADADRVGVINADDHYGGEPFALLAATAGTSLVTFPVARTILGDAPVTRALCSLADGRLTDIEEGTVDRSIWTGSTGRTVALTGNEPVSMNFWALSSDLVPQLEAASVAVEHDPNREALLPDVIRDELGRGSVVAAASYDGPCVGLTHPGDLDNVKRLLTSPAWP